MVNLKDITGEHDLGALARPGNDGLDFVGRQVLGFVHDEIGFYDAAPPDVRQGGDHDLFLFDQLFDTLAAGVVR